jgi:hypothetical protein
MSNLGTHLRDPLTNESYFFCDPEEVAQIWRELAIKFGVTFREIYKMIRVELLGPEGINDKFDPFAELNRLRREEERDADLLKLPLPIEEALAILERNRARVVAMLPYCSPEKRAEIEKFLDERDAAMKGLAERAKERSKDGKRPT